MTSLLVNPDNPYHWVQIKHSVDKELREWDPGGEYVTRQLDRIWTKYTGNPPPYGLRDPKIDEKRVLFVWGSEERRPDSRYSGTAAFWVPALEIALQRFGQVVLLVGMKAPVSDSRSLASSPSCVADR
jgi:hypothetical protein